MKFTIFSVDKFNLKGFSRTINLNLKNSNYLGFIQIDFNNQLRLFNIIINFEDIFLEIYLLGIFSIIERTNNGVLEIKRYISFSDIQTKKTYYIIIKYYHKNKKPTYTIFLKEIK